MNATPKITAKISLQSARRVMLASLGLDHSAQKPAVKTDVLEVIRSLGALQIDTIHVVARSPYLVLWSRLGGYPPEWLDELLAEGALFEYWAHAMCFLPIEDYPLYRRRMLDAAQSKGWPINWAVQWMQENPETIARVRSHLRENGAVRSAEFENKDHPAGGWWNWKDEKNALEALLYTGEVMIARRQNFQRVYDLRERILPGWDDAAVPAREEMERALTLRAVRHLGVAYPAWVSDYYRQPKKDMPQRLEALADEGSLARVQVEGLGGTAYVHPDRIALLEVDGSGGEPTLTTLLSPFDPLISDRQRAGALFNFDYSIECYTPAHKRRYGYFTLPILHRGKLVGRLDPKAHRAQRLFEVKALHLEPGVPASQELIRDLADALRSLADWHGTSEVVVRNSDPPEAAELLGAAL
jgi:uncharacterized protein YcaQ